MRRRGKPNLSAWGSGQQVISEFGQNATEYQSGNTRQPEWYFGERIKSQQLFYYKYKIVSLCFKCKDRGFREKMCVYGHKDSHVWCKPRFFPSSLWYGWHVAREGWNNSVRGPALGRDSIERHAAWGGWVYTTSLSGKPRTSWIASRILSESFIIHSDRLRF